MGWGRPFGVRFQCSLRHDVALARWHGDGQRNLDEYVAGLDPRDATSLFRIETVSVEEGQEGMITVRWETRPGRIYHLYFDETLGDLSGQPLFSVDGDGTMKVRQLATNGRNRLFCRITVELEER